MEPLDGNAIAGELFDYFGVEMTTMRGSCAHCGAVAQIAELRVYSRAPGSVVRCPTCDDVVMVLIATREIHRLHNQNFRVPLPAQEDAGR
jgi:hypothetical protein